MKVIFLALLIVLVIFVTGPTLMQAPLLIADLLDTILYAIVDKARQWKAAIKTLREVFFGD